jgi:three-Cys-motif partner protein
LPKQKRSGSDSYAWAKDRIKSLYDQVKDWKDTDITTKNHGIWSIKKLIALDCYIKPCVDIMRNNFNKIFYVDPFSGSGLIRLNGNLFPGSPLIPLLSHHTIPFDKYFLSDVNTRYVSVLKKRISQLRRGKDINVETEVSTFSEISKKLFSGKKPSYWLDIGYLVFLDPFGLQVDWVDMERILSSGPVDMIFTFMTWAIVWNKSNKLSKKRLTQYFGDESWQNLGSQDEFLNHYCRKIEQLGYDKKYKTIVIDVLFHGGKRYDIILASQNPAAARIFGYIQKQVTSIKNTTLENALTVTAGKQVDLDYYQK